MSDGCEQRERFPKALAEGYFRADETSFETLVAMSAGLGSRLRFIDQQHHPVGNWGELFNADEALVMARIIATDLAAPQAAFVRDADSAPLPVLAQQVLGLAHEVDGWFKSLSMSEHAPAQSLRARIDHLVARTLGDDLQWVFERFGAQRSKGEPVDPMQQRFDAMWFNVRPMRVVHSHRNDREVLRGRFFSFVSAMAQVQDLARELLPQSLNSQAHAPAAGLLMAFLQLHQVVQTRVNQFTDRHADFYYDDVLRMRPLPAVPDAVHVVCERDPKANREVMVARGTPFVAGKDALGQPIEFKADETLVVTDARVASLRTLQLGRDTLISPEREFGYVTRAEAAQLPWPPKAPAELHADAPPPHWPLFGGSSPSAPSGAAAGASRDARIGWVIASPLLFLQEGEREISLTLTLGHPVEVDHRIQQLNARIAGQPSATRRLLPVLFKHYLLLAPQLMSADERGHIDVTAVELARQAIERQAAHAAKNHGVDVPDDTTQAPAPTAAQSNPGFYERFLVELTLRAPTRAFFFLRLGKLFSHWLLSREDWLSEAVLADLREVASRLLREAALREAASRLLSEPELREAALRLPQETDLQKAADRLLKEADQLKAGSRLLDEAALREASSLLLREPELRDVASALSGQTDLRQAATRLFKEADLRKAMSRLLEATSLREAASRLLEETAVREASPSFRKETALREAASRLLEELDRTAPVAGDPRCLIQGPNRPERELIFAQIFNSIFNFSLSTTAGWMPVSDFYVTGWPEARPDTVPAPPAPATGTFTDLNLVLRLRPQDPAVVACASDVHGEDLPADLPALRMLLRSDGRIYPYSLLEDMLLNEASLTVRVQGLRDVVLDNNLGRLDASKPFMPFGPLPTTASYWVIGAPEIARKNISQLALNVRWSGLPINDGGFGSYYEAYDPALSNGSFTASASILRDGQWQPAGAPGSVALFRSADASGRLRAGARLVIDETALRAHAWASDEPLEFKLGARSGFYRIQLHGPAMAFGHEAYPGLLTKVVSGNTLRHRKHPLPLPAMPYTPLVEGLTLDYTAHSNMVFGREAVAADNGAEGALAERVLHIYPSGMAQVYPGGAGTIPTLFPRVDHAGNLYIGLTGEDIAGTLTLHFHLRDEAAVESLSGEPRPKMHWSYLASNQWRPLAPMQVVADTTCGMLTSGIVTLDLPGQIDRNNTILPADLYWLRLSVDSAFETFAGLYGVRAQALRATRVLKGTAATCVTALPAGSVKEPATTVIGLASVAQIGPSFGMRAAEDRRQMRTRVGERLQHKQRASTAWDYERLVLEHFPAVLKVKCFANLSARGGGHTGGPNGAPNSGGRNAGHVLVVVVPTPPTVISADPAGHPNDAAEAGLSATAEPHLNAVELARIQAYLQRLSSPFAQIQVRNAAYERILVRCTVKLKRGVQTGQALRRINQAITDYVSPWRPGGCQPSFDWTVRCEDVEAHVRALDCVDFVTQLSLLHVAQSDDHVFTLNDTARGQARLVSRARPRSPWSIALPMREHMVKTVDTSTDERPEVTGIAHLGIGGTFIIGKAAP